MPKVVVTRDTLVTMAQKCARVADRRLGDPTLEESAEMLEQAGFYVAELERRLEQWESFGRLVNERLPKDRSTEE